MPITGKLIDAIIQVESGFDDNAIGDKGLVNKAYGCLQIRQPYCDDVNRAYGTKFEAQKLLGWRSRSIAVFCLYMSIYATTARLGRIPTDEDIARIHNGGLNGYKNPATLAYWGKVQKVLYSGVV